MYWNHRIMKKIEGDEEILYVVECYYDDEDSTVIGWTEKEYVWGLDLDEIRTTLEWMTGALDKPVLDESELLRQVKEYEAAHPEPEEGYETLTLEELLDDLEKDHPGIKERVQARQEALEQLREPEPEELEP